MKKDLNPQENYQRTRDLCGWVPRHDATRKTYEDIGFMSGLEVHQQLNSKKKLFCRCPVGIYQDFEDYDTEVVRHMRPTLSELGEYDGTALMEFKTKKEIVYRLKNITTCTYELDDTPPFPLNREALAIATEISLLLKQNIVGEFHITRKQYLDGSIPTGFQRTGIIGIEGEIFPEGRRVGIIQVSIEEDSCREVSDIGHRRVYTTDRLGIPLIEVVTYPDMKEPNEVAAAAEFIRYLTRSTGKVRVGIGAGREDVNVSATGGTRVEIKGVAHISWIPELTHNEAFRQRALVHLAEEIAKRKLDIKTWDITSKTIDSAHVAPYLLEEISLEGLDVVTVNLPDFKGLLSWFTQPDQCLASEISQRLKVVACLEQPNMTHSEALKPLFDIKSMEHVAELLNAGDNDAQIIFFAPKDDIPTALETIKERCQMAFAGVPNETRKSFADGTTIFERVLPGADRMYPDTDSAPIPIEEKFIEDIREQLPKHLQEQIALLQDWDAPEDTYNYLLRNNLIQWIEVITAKFGIEPHRVVTLFGHRLKELERKHDGMIGLDSILAMFDFIAENKLNFEYAYELLKEVYLNPKMPMDECATLAGLVILEPNKVEETIYKMIEERKELLDELTQECGIKYVMGDIRRRVIGNLPMEMVYEIVVSAFKGSEEE
ncbi:MAG: Glu-tRNA(Gln) amidotransferase subunit GatE [Candidatus Zophobacter franzmannii]|nr:Glu-tRNA(Gln) amidotransferase subunit GatE [Candidatus Zophobacter franzmannii]